MAWTKTRDWPGQGGWKGEVSEKPAARQEEAATEPGELSGMRAGPGSRTAAKAATAALSGLRQLPGGSQSLFIFSIWGCECFSLRKGL